MRPTLKGLLALPAALLVIAFTSKPAEATPIVSIVPSFQNALVGNSVIVDIMVSGLTEPTGGFNLTLGYDPAILTGVGWTAGSGLGTSLDFLSGGFGVPAAGFLDLYVFSLDSAATLAALQGTGFSMISISFLAIGNGLSPLTLSNMVLSNGDGSATLAFTSTNGSVCVGGGNCQAAVPEPATLALLSIGLLALAARRLRAAR